MHEKARRSDLPGLCDRPTLARFGGPSERNVVVEIVDILLGSGGRLGAACGAAPAIPPAATAARGAREFGITAATTAAIATAEQLHAVSDNLRRILLDALLVGVLARLQPPFDIDRTSFFQIFAGDFGLASCAETDGEVMMVLVTYSSHGVSKQVGLPFLEWDSSSSEAFSGQTCLVLNTSVVNEKTIQLMRESAGDKVQLAIAKYRI